MRDAVQFFLDVANLDFDYENITMTSVMFYKVRVTVAIGIFTGVMGVLKAIIVELLRARNL
ncbi:MAG: hypothetical protein FWE90_08255 [Defluviitaleaceae bacterium]|nr:hypothetical protein [Defluviitaleaceae bacterium]